MNISAIIDPQTTVKQNCCAKLCDLVRFCATARMMMSPTVAYAGHLTTVIPDERPFDARGDMTVGDTDLRPTDSNQAPTPVLSPVSDCRPGSPCPTFQCR